MLKQKQESLNSSLTQLMEEDVEKSHQLKSMYSLICGRCELTEWTQMTSTMTQGLLTTFIYSTWNTQSFISFGFPKSDFVKQNKKHISKEFFHMPPNCKFCFNQPDC